jgi:hypothetical protein
MNELEKNDIIILSLMKSTIHSGAGGAVGPLDAAHVQASSST